MKVTDISGDTHGFKDDSTGLNDTSNDYSYLDGNLIKDENKGITDIKYNHLNLPTKITYASVVEYLYNAKGEKVHKHRKTGTRNYYTDYLDGFQYLGGVLQFFPTSEGYVRNTVVDGTNVTNYIFNHVDHLGNIRISYGYDPAEPGVLKVMEENNYYPFGLKHENYNVNQYDYINGGDGTVIVGVPVLENGNRSYTYRYNGKEWQDELGLNMYDYHARNYDPTIGRWMNIDPLAETSRRHSPFAYALNNPIYFIDPDGMQALATWGVDTNGNITKIDDKKYYDKDGKEIDKLISGNVAKYDENGDLKNESVDVSLGVLEGKSKTPKTVREKKGKTKTINITRLNFGKNSSEARKVFEFLADNTNVEYTLLQSIDPNNMSLSTSAIFTSHLDEEEWGGPEAAKRFARTGVLFQHDHNHPPGDGSGPSDNDIGVKSMIMRATQEAIQQGRKTNNPKFNIYFNGSYHPY